MPGEKTRRIIAINLLLSVSLLLCQHWKDKLNAIVQEENRYYNQYQSAILTIYNNLAFRAILCSIGDTTSTVEVKDKIQNDINSIATFPTQVQSVAAANIASKFNIVVPFKIDTNADAREINGTFDKQKLQEMCERHDKENKYIFAKFLTQLSADKNKVTCLEDLSYLLSVLMALLNGLELFIERRKS